MDSGISVEDGSAETTLTIAPAKEEDSSESGDSDGDSKEDSSSKDDNGSKDDSKDGSATGGSTTIPLTGDGAPIAPFAGLALVAFSVFAAAALRQRMHME